MKKTLSLIIAGILCLTALCACSGSSNDVEPPSVDLSYDEQSYFVPGGTSDSEESGQPSEQQGGFAVKLGKYDYNTYAERKLAKCKSGPYKDVSIAILDVTNETAKNYSVTIHGSYLDKDGNVLMTETQEWDQFASGWQKYFLFRPGMAFDKFTYTIETEEFEGDCWKTKISYTFLGLEKSKGLHSLTDYHVKVEGLVANVHVQNDASKEYSVGIQYVVFFDESGQVICVYHEGVSGYVPAISGDTYFGIYYSDQDGDGTFDEWPEMFRGNVTAIFVDSWIDEVSKFGELEAAGILDEILRDAARRDGD